LAIPIKGAKLTLFVQADLFDPGPFDSTASLGVTRSNQERIMIFPISSNCSNVKKIAMNRGVTGLLTLFALCFSCLVEAGLDEGVAAMERNDYEAAFREFQPLADQGVAEAQFMLGLLYSDGRGVAKNPAKAVSLYRDAAEQGLAHAQHSLGDMYFLGVGVAENNAEAMNWYERAAKQGHPQAQFNLASMYSVGSGRAQSLVLAYMWCSLSVTGWPAGEVRARRQSMCDEVLPEMSERDVAKARELINNFVPKEERASHPLFRTIP
jgi:hypothetical protein